MDKKHQKCPKNGGFPPFATPQDFFCKNRALSLLYPYGALTSCKKLEKTKKYELILNSICAINVFDFLKYIEVSFFQGWEKNHTLLNILEDNIYNDKRRKTTLFGPHKSDIKFFINNIDAKQILSRGEQKFFSILWSCAQNEVLKKEYNIDPVLIIDDIKSELDERVFDLLIKILQQSKNQIIFSCIDDTFSSKIADSLNQFKMFHVEQLR